MIYYMAELPEMSERENEAVMARMLDGWGSSREERPVERANDEPRTASWEFVANLSGTLGPICCGVLEPAPVTPERRAEVLSTAAELCYLDGADADWLRLREVTLWELLRNVRASYLAPEYADTIDMLHLDRLGSFLDPADGRSPRMEERLLATGREAETQAWLGAVGCPSLQEEQERLKSGPEGPRCPAYLMAGFEGSRVQTRIDGLLVSRLLWGSLESRRVTTVTAGPAGIADQLLISRSVQGSSLVLDAGCWDGERLTDGTLLNLYCWDTFLHDWAPDATLVVTVGTDEPGALAAIEKNMPSRTFVRMTPPDNRPRSAHAND